MEGAIHEVEAGATHVLLAEKTFLGGPLGDRSDMLIDFKHVLHSNVLVSYKIGAFVFSAPSPNLTGSHFIPVKLVTVQLSSVLRICFWASKTSLNGFAESIIHRLSCDVQAIVLVRQILQADLDMQLTATGDDVLACLFGCAHHQTV